MIKFGDAHSKKMSLKKEKNIHIICAPRSCSTVIGVGLGEHNRLLFCPEVNLWSYETLNDMIKHDIAECQRVGFKNTIIAGLVRVLLEASKTFVTEDHAISWLYDRRNWSTSQIESFLTHLMKPKYAVYKSTRLSMSPSGLQRLENSLGSGLIVHLVRNPLASIRSLAHSNPGSDDLDAHAHTWLYANTNIERFAGQLQNNELVVLRAEDILAEPRKYLTLLSLKSGHVVQPEDEIAMLKPECSSYADSSHPKTEYYMDQNFIENSAFRLEGSAKLDPFEILRKISHRYRAKIEAALHLYGYR